MPTTNSAKQSLLRHIIGTLKSLCLVFLLAGLWACQHQSTIANKDTATHLPQAKPLTPEERAAAIQASNIAKIKQDKYLSAFLFSGFDEAPEKVQETNKPETPPATAVESGPATIESSHLVSVEVWSIILGEEKISLLTKAQSLGATQLPPPSEWHQWKMAIGSLDKLEYDQYGVKDAKGIEDDTKKTILFIAPPDFAKFKNGDHVIVEISISGGVHIARYMK